MNNCGKRTYVGKSLLECWMKEGRRLATKSGRIPTQKELEGHVFGTNYAANTRYVIYRQVVRELRREMAMLETLTPLLQAWNIA